MCLTLEVALFSLGVAREGGLWLLLLQLIENLAVCDIAHLVVLIHQQTLPVADSIHSLGHHGAACIVRLADIAVYALPSLFTLAVMTLAWEAILAICKRTAKRFTAVFATKARGTIAFSRRLGTVGELVTYKVV